MPPVPGYWGKTSATVDWCEENYAVTPYIAEFWNTLSNVMTVVPTLLAAILATRQKLEYRIVLCYVGVMVVGIGSCFFHMTLLYSMQLFDELPMLWVCTCLLYSLAEAEKPLNSNNIPLQVGLLGFCSVVTLVYLTYNTPLFFQLAFSAMAAAAACMCWRLIILHWSKLNIYLGFIAFGCYVLGAIVWVIDSSYCSNIRKMRSSTVAGMGPITQLHAWWHILAGVGSYFCILFCFHSRYVLLHQDPRLKFWNGVWPYLDIEKPLRRI